MKIAVAIAAYDEQESIEALTRRLHATLTAYGQPWELVYVIEGRDQTLAIATRLQRELSGDIRILYNEHPSGLGAAYRTAFGALSPDADLVITMDADLNHQPEEIPRLIERLERSGAAIVVGSRAVSGSRVTGTPLIKRLLSRAMNLLMRLLFGGVSDKTSGFRAYRAEVLRTLAYENDQFAFLPEMIVLASRAGHRIVEEPIHFIFRIEGTSKMRFWPTSLSYLVLLRTWIRRT